MTAAAAQGSSLVTQKTLKLAEIYGPISDDLKKTEALFSEVLASDNDFVLEMVRHFGQSFGKQIRSALVLLTYRACKAGVVAPGSNGYQKSLVVAEAIELIHNATLVHDDIIDNSPMRRGAKTLNYQWGNEVTVLMGDFIFARVFGLLARSVESPVIQTISAATDRLCEGEIQEVHTRFLVNQSEAEYFEIIEKKTAALMAVACEAAALVAGAPATTLTAVRKFGLKIGMAFQVVDDLLDLQAPAEKLGKPQGHDIREGKITLPLIYALRQSEPARKAPIQDVLLKDSLSDADLASVVQFIREGKGVGYAAEKASSLVQEAKQELEILPESTAKKSLQQLADYIVAREY
jgi:geranylgeranyl pyrophosphate synthase